MNKPVKTCKCWLAAMPSGALRLWSFNKKHEHMNVKKVCTMRMRMAVIK